MGTDVGNVEMLGIKQARSGLDVLTVEIHTRMTDDKGVNPQIEGRMAGVC